jgi:hypothetical protein
MQVKNKYFSEVGIQREIGRSPKLWWEPKVHCNVDSILTSEPVAYRWTGNIW